MEIDPRIFYLIVVPDGKPEEATPLEGFALSLCRNSWMIRSIADLPSTIFDLSDRGRKTLIPRRITGGRPVYWQGQSPKAIFSSVYPENIPFVLVLLGEDLSAAEYMEWSKGNAASPTIVSKQDGHLSYEDLNLEALGQRLTAVCDALPASIDAKSKSEAKKAISEWCRVDTRDLGYKVGGHNTVAPNVFVLESAGFGEMYSGPMERIAEGIEPYVEQIVRTSRSIFEERERQGVRRLARFIRPTFDLNLFAPAIYPDVLDMKVPLNMGREERERFIVAKRMLEQQSGYSYSSRTPAQHNAFFGIKKIDKQRKRADVSPHPLFQLRQMELHLATNCMVAFAVSEFTAVVRLPNAVNRTSGVVHSFAEHYRSKAPTTRKRLRAFQAVQRSLAQAVPRDFLQLVRESQTGVRIVADAHLEWLDVDGLPLGIRKDVTRIPVTPGNSFVDMLSAYPPVLLTPKDFARILVISAMERDEPLSGLMAHAIQAFQKKSGDSVRVEFVDVSSADELVAVLNGYDGALVIFDGHGGHQKGDAGKLYLKGAPVDVWTLKNRLTKVPPIVILSACDTHAADRNHGTVANGFLALGARTVLGSVFPLAGIDAAIFVARLLYRVAEFLPGEIRRRRRPVTWSELISGMLRMQLMTDYLRHLMASGLISEAVYKEVHYQANMWINLHTPDPFERVDALLAEYGMECQRLKIEREIAIANSSFISYLQLGRPELVMVGTEEMMA